MGATGPCDSNKIIFGNHVYSYHTILNLKFGVKISHLILPAPMADCMPLWFKLNVVEEAVLKPTEEYEGPEKLDDDELEDEADDEAESTLRTCPRRV